MECAGIAVRPDFFALPIGKGDRPENWVRPLEVFGASGGACLVRRSLFDRVGAFAEKFFAYYEDVDFAIRCRLAGYRCLYVPDAVVRHLGGATARRLGWKVAYLSARNQLWTLMRCCPGRLMASLGFKILRSQLANLAAAAIERHFLATLLGKIAALVGAAGQLRRRREIQRRARNLDEFRGWLEQPFREL